MRRPKKQATDVASASLFSRAAWQPSGKQAQRPVTDQLVHLCIDDASPVLVGSNFIPELALGQVRRDPMQIQVLRGGRPKDIEITACHVTSLAAASNCAFAVTGDVCTKKGLAARGQNPTDTEGSRDPVWTATSAAPVPHATATRSSPTRHVSWWQGPHISDKWQ